MVSVLLWREYLSALRCRLKDVFRGLTIFGNVVNKSFGFDEFGKVGFLSSNFIQEVSYGVDLIEYQYKGMEVCHYYRASDAFASI